MISISQATIGIALWLCAIAVFGPFAHSSGPNGRSGAGSEAIEGEET